MKTIIGNYTTNYVTTIYPRYDKFDEYCITARQWANALKRMKAPNGAKMRFAPVAGAKIEHIKIVD